MLDAAHRKVRMADPGGSKEAHAAAAVGPHRALRRPPADSSARERQDAPQPEPRRPANVGRFIAPVSPPWRPRAGRHVSVTHGVKPPAYVSPRPSPPCRGPARAAPRGHMRPARRCEGRGRGHTGAHLKAQGEPRSITATGPPRRAGSAASGASRATAARATARAAAGRAAVARLAQWRRARSPGASSRAPRPSGEGRCGCRPQRSAPRAEGRRDSCCRPFVTRAIRFCGGSLRLGHRRRCGASPSPCSRRQLRMTHYPMKGRCVPRATSR